MKPGACPVWADDEGPPSNAQAIFGIAIEGTKLHEVTGTTATATAYWTIPAKLTALASFSGSFTTGSG